VGPSAPDRLFLRHVLEKNQIRLGMVGANLCGDCEVKLAGMGLNDQALGSIEQMLQYVRDATIRRPRGAPTKIFIGHGHSPVWLQLERFLVDDLGLEVEEFNKDATAGVATTERLAQMLERSCFAFLVMTAEDARRNKNIYARQNVIHELGLFQGSLGFRRAIVLKERRVAPFSNIDGLTYIGFTKDHLDNAAKVEVCRTLERERIIESSLSRRVQRRLQRVGRDSRSVSRRTRQESP
jgi:CAP12/Pycsar effector protein, TIR domain